MTVARYRSGCKRGFTLIEVLMALLIFGIAVAGGYSLWSSSFANVYATNGNSVGAELARADIEKAKATGFSNLPVGTVSGTTGTYTGTTSSSTNIAEWYDVKGNFLSFETSSNKSTPSNAAYKLVRVTTTTLVAGSGSSYIPTQNSVMSVVTTVTRLSDSSTQYTMGTELVYGGI